MPQVRLVGAHRHDLVDLVVAPLAQQAHDEEQVDPGDDGIHRDHRPDVQDGVEDGQRHAGREVEQPKTQDARLQQRIHEQGRTGPAQSLDRPRCHGESVD
ncbi:hypothetical protein [Tetrasphaera sp. HKS02]|uniref:hypothetical protein n=1 Tax=Nostocoides sp. HKS02 TaxID=1813880 RepID=UPI0012B476A3|nr:hypothetical protein GKE56_01610 [Tetrasphaera sp. HKS02]